jgi:predicted Zn-dependent peptidase
MALRERHFKKTVYGNQLTLVTERQPEFQSLSIGFWVKVGTRFERSRETGLSHFLEHMLFKGTEERTALQIAREVDQVGGEFNAFTSREYTCFHLLLLNRDLDLGIDILTDVLLHSQFDAEEMERERKVILQEITMVEESPEELVHDLFFEKIYGRHGLGRPILGTETSVRRFKRRHLLNFFRRHYRPEEVIVSVAGDVSHPAVSRKLKALARPNWPGRSREHPSRKDLGFSPAPHPKEGNWWIQRKTEQVHLVWGVEGPRTHSRDRFTALLLNVYLGGGMSSVLFQEIREKKGLAYTVYSNLSSFLDSGIFSIYAATVMNQVPLCLKLIEQCVAKVRQQLLTDEELQVIKNNLKGTLLLSSDSVESRMSSLAKNEIFFRENFSVSESCQQIDAIQPSDLRRVARKIFSHPKRSILALGPKPSRLVQIKLRPELL